MHGGRVDIIGIKTAGRDLRVVPAPQAQDRQAQGAELVRQGFDGEVFKPLAQQARQRADEHVVPAQQGGSLLERGQDPAPVNAGHL